jgi:hypothetical protein
MTTEGVVTIRAASLEEVDNVARMYEWLFAPLGALPSRWEPRSAAAALRRAVASDVASVLVAEHESTLVGVSAVYEDFESVTLAGARGRPSFVSKVSGAGLRTRNHSVRQAELRIRCRARCAA